MQAVDAVKAKEVEARLLAVDSPCNQGIDFGRSCQTAFSSGASTMPDNSDSSAKPKLCGVHLQNCSIAT
jgi:hypothetical protein